MLVRGRRRRGPRDRADAPLRRLGSAATIAAPKPFRVVFPEGFTRMDMAHRVQVVAGIAYRERGVKPRLSAKTYLRASYPRRIAGFGRKTPAARGLPLPRDVRLPREHDVGAARARAAAGVPAELAEREPVVRALEEPDAVRRADHRVARREGGAGAGRAAEDRARDLQPAARAHEPRHRRDHALRPARARDEVADAVGAEQRQPVQHAESEHHRTAADADREPRASPRSRRPRTRRRATGSTSCASRISCTTSSRTTTRRS